jgi:hypothetical protein
VPDPRTTRRSELTKKDDNLPTLELAPRESTLFEFEAVISSSELFDWRGELEVVEEGAGWSRWEMMGWEHEERQSGAE